ncbi:sensor histidine kinase [Candidatus Omnitrophota bacterium]
MKLRNSLRKKLTLAFVCLSVLPLLFFGIFISCQSYFIDQNLTAEASIYKNEMILFIGILLAIYLFVIVSLAFRISRNNIKPIEVLNPSQEQLFQTGKLASIGRLGAGIAHELNSPLMGVMSLVGIYKEMREEGSEEYEHLKRIEEACKYMAKIIKDLNAFARPSVGKLEDLNFNEVIEATLSFSAFQVKRKNVVIEKNFEEKLSFVRGDSGQLQQVVLNLVMNAMDALDEGGVFKIITRNMDIEGTKHVEVEFCDDGCGIDKDNLKKIFDPFFTTKRPECGVGLGLSIVCTIIKNCNGEIFVESELGKGTTFRVRLPAV